MAIQCIHILFQQKMLKAKLIIIFSYFSLSHDVTVNQSIMSCHKNLMTTRVIILWNVHVTSLTTYVLMHFLSKYCSFRR